MPFLITLLFCLVFPTRRPPHLRPSASLLVSMEKISQLALAAKTSEKRITWFMWSISHIHGKWVKTLLSWIATHCPYSQPQTSEQQPIDFASILQNSLFRTMSHKATCQNCKQYTTFATCRSLASQSLPPFLAVNASVYNESLSFWQDSRDQRFLQPQVYLHGQTRGIDDSQNVPYVVRVCHSSLVIYSGHEMISFRPW